MIYVGVIMKDKIHAIVSFIILKRGGWSFVFYKVEMEVNIWSVFDVRTKWQCKC